MQKLISFPILLFFLSGCYQTSLAPMIGPAAGVSQGRLAYSAVSTSVSYGVKQATGKFPIEHIIAKEKKRIAKKTSELEDKIIGSAKKKIEISKEKILPIKNNIKKQVTKLRWVLHIKEIKNVTEEEAFTANKPRYSYWSKQK